MNKLLSVWKKKHLSLQSGCGRRLHPDVSPGALKPIPYGRAFFTCLIVLIALLRNGYSFMPRQCKGSVMQQRIAALSPFSSVRSVVGCWFYVVLISRWGSLWRFYDPVVSLHVWHPADSLVFVLQHQSVWLFFPVWRLTVCLCCLHEAALCNGGGSTNAADVNVAFWTYCMFTHTQLLSLRRHFQ